MRDFPPEHLIVRELVERGGFKEFIPIFWQKIDPAPFVPGWHIDAMADHLEAVDRREIKRLVINVPTGCGKTKITSVLWNAHGWIKRPDHKWMFASYDPSLVTGAAGKVLDVLNDPLYRAAFPNAAQPKGRGEIVLLETKQGGLRVSTSVGGSATGKHVNTQVVDDPTKPLDAKKSSGAALKIAEEWWCQTMASRIAEPADQFARVVIMQRLVLGDLAQICLDQGYEHLCLPLEYVPKCSWDRGSTLTRTGKFRDPRTKAGESLNAARYTPETLASMNKEFGPVGASAQLQQNPTPDRGGYVEREWLDQTYDCLPVSANKMRFAQFWDLASKGREDSSHSRVHGALFGIYKSNIYLIEERLGWWNYPQTKREFIKTQLSPAWIRAGRIWIEDKANGTPLLQELKEDPTGRLRAFVSKLKAFEPGPVSKEDRFALETDKIENGLLWLPTVANAPWITEWKTEIINFPNDPANTDRVDTLCMALNKCLKGGPGWAGTARGALEAIARAHELARSRD